MKIKFFWFNLILTFLITSCGSNTADTSKDEEVFTTENNFENIENNQQEVNKNEDSQEVMMDTTTNDGDTIDVDPKFYDVNGNEVRLSDFKGKPTVINFWASWCVPCQYEFNDFQQSYETYGEDVQFLMIDLIGVRNETEEIGKKYISENEYTFPTYYDSNSEVFYSMLIKQIPTTFFVNSDGLILNKEIGLMSQETLEENLKLLIQNNE